jgi:hypothetical protein
MSVNSSQKRGSRAEAGDARLRYHLTSLYALRPIPEDLMELVREIGTRATVARHATKGD